MTSSARGYGTVARLFHWLTALLVLAMIPLGIAIASGGFESISDTLFVVHKGTGSVLLVLVVVRLLWRLASGPPPPHPDMTPRQARMADLTHVALYLLLLIMTGSGYVRVVGGGYPIELLNWLGIPPLLPEMQGVADAASVVHKLAAYAFTALIAAHIAAAAHHALSHGTGILGRMWPPFGARR